MNNTTTMTWCKSNCQMWRRAQSSAGPRRADQEHDALHAGGCSSWLDRDLHGPLRHGHVQISKVTAAVYFERRAVYRAVCASRRRRLALRYHYRWRFQSCRSPCCPHCLASNRRPNLNCEVFQLLDRVGSKPSCVFNRRTSIGADYITLDAPEIG